MSECVVRMTLPKACVWRDDKGHIKMCPLYWEDEARCQGKDGKEAPWYDGKRPDWCPIICQLPEGHGRLVDADALIERLKKEKVDMQKHIPKGFAEEIAGMYGEIDGVICSIVTANRMPTIVPAAPKEEKQDDGN